MTEKKRKRRSPIGSVVAIIICFSLLLGTTFAWFTDAVSSQKNIIKAGNLDIDLQYMDENKEWQKVDPDKSLFSDELWEPGHTEVVYLKVANLGTLALKYELGVNIVDEKGSVSVKTNEKFKLSDFIYFDVIDVTASDIPYEDRDAARDKVVDAEIISTDYTKNGELYPVGNAEGKESEKMVALVVYMPETVDNAANYITGEDAPEIELGIKVNATQFTYEEDSFDNKYDENAPELGIPEDDNKLVIEENEWAELVVNDKTQNTPVNFVRNEGVLTVNGEGTDPILKTGTSADYGLITSGENAETVVNDVDIVSGGGGIAAAGGAKVTFNSGSLAVNSASTSGRYLFYAEGAGSVITINDGDFSFSKTLNQKRAYIYAGAGTTVYVNGGTFGTASTRSGYTAGILGDGNIIITGGTFGFDPSNWVADGYEAVKSGTTWTVSAK